MNFESVATGAEPPRAQGYIILIYGIEWQMPLAGQSLLAEQHARPGSMCDIRIFHLLLAGWVGGRRAM